MWISFAFLVVLQIGGSLCRSSGDIPNDKHQRKQKTMEIIWPHLDWNEDECTNFGSFSCKDIRNSSKEVKCVTDSRDLKASKLSKHRQKRQLLYTSELEVRSRLEIKMQEIIADRTMDVEPGVYKMAQLYYKMGPLCSSNEVYHIDWMCKLALLSVSNLMEEYLPNKKMFEELIPRFREVGIEIGSRAFSDRDHVHKSITNLKINIGFRDLDLPKLLTKLLKGLSPIENYTKTIEVLTLFTNTSLLDLVDNFYHNAFYNHSDHSLNFAPLFFLSPTFRTDFMHSHFFGGVLSVFFHELGHSISYPINLEESKNLTICVQNEVENMSLTLECPNERVRLTENHVEEIMADKLGLAMAWYMYNEDYKHLDLEHFDFKGRNFSREKIFFISFGLNLCNTELQGVEERIATNGNFRGHPNPRNRKNLAVKTIPTFFDAFQCTNVDADYTRCPLFGEKKIDNEP